MAKQILTSFDLLSLPSLTTPKTGSVGFGAKSDGLYQKIGTVETKLSVDGHTHTIAQITGLQGALDSKATPSDISTAVNNLEIGGRNYFRHLFTDTYNGSSVQPVNGWYVADTGNYGGIIFSTVYLEEGNTYTISFEYKTTDNSGWYTISSPRSAATVKYNSNKTLNLIQDGEVHKKILQITATATEEVSICLLRQASSGTVYYKENSLKVEKGNKATDWTPAPEDQVSDWNESNSSSFSFIKNKPTQLSQFTDNIGVGTHIANKANPHEVTKAQVGLGNVDNVKQATKSEFDTHTGNTTVHITSTERTNWNDANSKKHTHGNKSVLDALTQGNIDVLSKLSIDANGDLKIDTNAYATGEISAYGSGTGGGGGTGYERLDAWADYDSSKSGWVLSALLGVDLNNRLSNVEGGSATSITTTGSGNAITSVSKSGNTLTFTKGSTFSLSTHNHDTIYKPIGYVPSWSEITGKPSEFTPSAHTHTIAQITGLQSALDGKQPTISTGTTSQYYRGDKTWQTLNTSVVPEGNNLYFTNARVKAYGDTVYKPIGYVPSWSEITGKPSTFAPSSHTHTIANVTGLQSALDGKQPTISTGTTSQYYRGDKTWQTLNTSVVPEGNNLYFTNARVKAYGDTLYSPLGHTHTIAQITGLQGALDSKATPSDISTAVNNLQIGGRNLLLNSAPDFVVNSGSEPYRYISIPVNDYTGKMVSYSMSVNNIVGFTAMSIGIFDFATSTWKVSLVNCSITDGKVKREGMLVPVGTGNYAILVYAGIAGSTAGNSYKGSHKKLELGNKATDWTPAPEDQVSDWSVTDVNSFAFIKNKPTKLSQFTDNIGVASHIANKANPHAVTTAQIGAVDLTTNQTITGIKTFDANIILGVNRYIQGTDNYAGVWNVDNLLWRFGSRKAGSVANIRSEKVGIGTDAPLYKLDVTGDGRFTGNLTASAGVNTPKVDFGNGFTVEPSGTELVFKYNGVIKQRMLSDGTILATGGVTALATN